MLSQLLQQILILGDFNAYQSLWDNIYEITFYSHDINKIYETTNIARHENKNINAKHVKKRQKKSEK